MNSLMCVNYLCISTPLGEYNGKYYILDRYMIDFHTFKHRLQELKRKHGIDDDSIVVDRMKRNGHF